MKSRFGATVYKVNVDAGFTYPGHTRYHSLDARELKDPYDKNVAIYSLDMQLKQIWIYNYKTGQVLYKEDQPTKAEVKWH
jgi:hypothetical protein